MRGTGRAACPVARERVTVYHLGMRPSVAGSLALGCVALLAACSSSDKAARAPADVGADAGADAGHAATCTVRLSPSDDDQAALQGALIDATDGDTVCLGKGRYRPTGQLTLASEGVTVRGDDGAVLDFSDQSSGANGIELSADRDTLENLEIENPKGDGVRASQVDRVTLRGLRVVWTGGPDAKNGGYGLYPVLSSHVLIEDCYVSGASDAGIYVGQSETIVMRNNEVAGNVAGMEVENSTDADVYGNHAHDNAAGILIFNLPGLRVKDGKRAKVHDNVIEHNNGDNFAAAGNIVADVPSGTGMFILASDDNEVHDNRIEDHDSTGIAVLSWYVAMRDADGMKDAAYDWFPERNSVHDNSFDHNGSMPHGTAELLASLVGVTTFPDMAWDGIVDSAKLGGDGGVDGGDGAPDAGADAGAAAGDGGAGTAPIPPDALRNCFRNNGDASFMNLDLEQYGARASSDIAPYECERPALPAIEL